MELSKKDIERVLVDFIMYEKQGMTFYTEENAKEYLSTYLKLVKKFNISGVGSRRELLIGYNEYLEGMYNAECLEDDDVDLYLKTN